MPYKDIEQKRLYNKERLRQIREKKYKIQDEGVLPENYINTSKPILTDIFITDEIFDKFDLKIIYSNNKKNQIDILHDKYVVYLIKTNQKYYVGSTQHINQRINGHKQNNTNNINNNGLVYILEIVNNYEDMIKMENIWIYWFWYNSRCVNKLLLGFSDLNYILHTKYSALLDIGIINKP